MIPIGTLIRKIQCQLALEINQPPRIGPRIGPSSIGTPRMAIRRPIRAGPAARVMMVMPSGMSMPPPRPCSVRKVISMLIEDALAHSAESAGEQHQGQDVQPLGAEPVGRPSGERDDRGQRQRVGGDRPGHGRVRDGVVGAGGEHRLERRQRDVDHGDVEDRHDRAEHDHPRKLQHCGVDLVGMFGGDDCRHGGPHRHERTGAKASLGPELASAPRLDWGQSLDWGKSLERPAALQV